MPIVVAMLRFRIIPFVLIAVAGLARPASGQG